MNIENQISPPESNTRQWAATGVALVGGILAALLRVVPHPPNFNAVGGLGIFGGARLSGWRVYVLPLAIMVASDLCLWVATGFDLKYSLLDLSRVPVYASFMLYVFIGRFLQNRNSFQSVLIAATIGGVQFFVLTNFFDWLVQPYQPYYDQIPEFFRYTRDFEGLAKCFIVALGFYQQETGSHPFMLVTNFPTAMLVWPILGDIVFTTVYMLVYAKVAPGEAAAAAPSPVANA